MDGLLLTGRISEYGWHNSKKISCRRDTARRFKSVCVCACLSVCVYVTFVSCVKTNKDIFEFFYCRGRSGSHTILDFPYQTGWRYSDGNPPSGGRGVE